MVSIYLMRSGETDLYKIGIAQDPVNRAKKLQNGNPEDLNVICSRKIINAEQVEAKLHKAFASKRIRKGEWFRLDKKALIFIWRIFFIQWPNGVITDLNEFYLIIKEIKDSCCGQLKLFKERNPLKVVFTSRGSV